MTGLRAGDDSVKHRIILSHTRLALRIAHSVARSYPEHRDEMVSAAFAELVDCVNRFQVVGDNNHITPYIQACVKGHVLRVPGILASMVGSRGVKRQNDTSLTLEHDSGRCEADVLEMREAFLAACDDEVVRAILLGHLEGETLTDIAKKIGYSVPSVSVRFSNLKKRIRFQWL